MNIKILYAVVSFILTYYICNTIYVTENMNGINFCGNIFLLICVNFLNIKMVDSSTLFPYSMGRQEKLIIYLSICIFGPLFEEIIFRHSVPSLLGTYISAKYYNILSAILFSLMHGSNYLVANNKKLILNQLFMTFLFGYICVRMDNLIISIIAHIIYNHQIALHYYFYNKSRIIKLHGGRSLYLPKRSKSDSNLHSNKYNADDYEIKKVSEKIYNEHIKYVNKLNNFF